MKRRHAWLLCAWLAFPALASRQVVDDAGHTVTVPDRVSAIADGWFAHHSVLMTLGAGSLIVATVNHPESQPWMFKITPTLHHALQVRGTAFNPESLLAKRVDLVFTARGNDRAESYRQAGLPTLEMAFTDYPSLMKSVTTTAKALGTQTARQRAADYNQYLQSVLQNVQHKTQGLTDAQRPTVLHIQSLKPLKVDGSKTLIDTWITLAGGKNAAAGIEGNMREVSPEQILAWQPDVIILGANCGSLANSTYAGLFAGLKAVKNNRVQQNPAGVFPWDRYGTESALQIQWAAAMLHPDLFPDVNMASVTQAFYRRFFDYPLNDAEALRILQALPPSDV
ncbi:TPA: ABC transporter substrate-binding protein [Kluyvera georgiana]